MKLSYRDKVIFIVAIVIVIIVAGIFLFIKPTFESMNNAKYTLQSKQNEKADVEAKINTLPDIVASLKASAQDIEELQEYFMTVQDPYLNEQYVREILGNNVEIYGMSTSYTVVNDLEEYVVNKENVAACDLFIKSDIYDELPQEVYDAYNNIRGVEGDSIVIGVTSMSVKYKDKADYSGIYKFIDAVEEDGKTLIVTEFSKEELDRSATEAEGNVSLVIYSIYPLDVAKVMEESEEFVFDPSLVPAEETPAAE
ncbi:MAG: hypothetical protein ACI4YB_07810 [Oscillospiraceae bacterium]